MSAYLRVRGWKPTSARLHVSNVEELVKSLGGTHLYGDADQLAVVLRELIQNARDAVAARRALDPAYVGLIRVGIHSPEPGVTYLEVDDDGVGMSERVLTGPLLDFGTSFWISNLVQQEFPGLRSSPFRSVGRFGIGFYSVFMVAQAVTVSSRNWKSGLNDVRTLSFPNGLTLRPTLSRSLPEGFGAGTSTRVSCRLQQDAHDLEAIRISRQVVNTPDIHVRFPDFVAAIVAGLDVAVECRGTFDGEWANIHLPIQEMVTLDLRRDWLNRIAFGDYLGDVQCTTLIEEYATRLRFVSDQGEICGLAALASHYPRHVDFLLLEHLAVLPHLCTAGVFLLSLAISTMMLRQQSEIFPRRLVLAAMRFLLGQMSRLTFLERQRQPQVEWCHVTCSLSDLRVDPMPIAHALVHMDGSDRALELSAIFDVVRCGGLAIFKSSYGDYVETYTGRLGYLNHPTLRPIRPSAFMTLTRHNGVPTDIFSFIGCLYRYGEGLGVGLEVEERPAAVQGIFGPLDVLLVRASE